MRIMYKHIDSAIRTKFRQTTSSQLRGKKMDCSDLLSVSVSIHPNDLIKQQQNEKERGREAIELSATACFCIYIPPLPALSSTFNRGLERFRVY